jgi:hypothetical protein
VFLEESYKNNKQSFENFWGLENYFGSVWKEKFEEIFIFPLNFPAKSPNTSGIKLTSKYNLMSVSSINVYSGIPLS